MAGLVPTCRRGNKALVKFPVLQWLIDFALPPRCPGCGAIVAADHRFCTPCWASLDFLTGDGCTLCNAPLNAVAAGTICAPCLEQPPRHDGVRAAVSYGPVARDVVLRLKYSRKTGNAGTIGKLIARSIDGDGMIVPVPLHRWRLWGRGFNQAALIAASLSKASGLPVATGLLHRKRATQSMRGLSSRKRADAVRGAFRTTARIGGGTVWLVDDVYTSGATANACAATLKRAGADRVVVVTWARVLRED